MNMGMGMGKVMDLDIDMVIDLGRHMGMDMEWSFLKINCYYMYVEYQTAFKRGSPI
jgi:hypothetical protein